MNEAVFQDAIFARLKGDATLLALLKGKPGPEYGIYRQGQKRDEPNPPWLEIHFLSSTTSTMTSEENEQLVTITAWGGDTEAIHARVENLLKPSVSPLTGTDLRMHTFELQSKGTNLQDNERRIHFRPDTYLARYSLDGPRL